MGPRLGLYAVPSLSTDIARSSLLAGAKGARTGAPAAVAANTTMPVTAANGTMATPVSRTDHRPTTTLQQDAMIHSCLSRAVASVYGRASILWDLMRGFLCVLPASEGGGPRRPQGPQAPPLHLGGERLLLASMPSASLDKPWNIRLDILVSVEHRLVIF